MIGCLQEKEVTPTSTTNPTTTTTITTSATNTSTASNTSTTTTSTTTTLSLPCSDASTTNAQNQICFDTAILPLIVSNCAMSGCHDAITRADGYDLSSYNKIVSKGVISGNYKGSKIYTEIASGSMPPKPRIALKSTQAQLIADWIQQGAKQVTCAGNSMPTTTTISYVQHISPLLQLNCTGCHSAAVPSGNVDLSTYTAVKKYVATGQLYGSVAHLVGYKPMPSTVSKLSDCQISVIKSWIDAGAANN
jgi:hypothetical protein